MKPLVSFPDPEVKVVEFYKTTGVADVVTTSFPSTALTGTTKHLQVELEVGGAQDYPVTERAQVRMTCHMPKGQRSAVKNFATLAQGRLYAWTGDAEVAGAEPMIGRSNVTQDPDTGNLMVWFLFRVNLKATQLAS